MEFFRIYSVTKSARYVRYGKSKDFAAAKKVTPSGTWPDQNYDAYPTVPAWHVFVSLRLLDSYVVVLYWF